jgi:cell division protein FtsW (lipid II flippase)
VPPDLGVAVVAAGVVVLAVVAAGVVVLAVVAAGVVVVAAGVVVVSVEQPKVNKTTESARINATVI